MKIRMKYQLSGTRDGEPWPEPGGVVDLPDSEAAKYCGNGTAEPVAARAEVEKAVAKDDAEERKSGLTTKRGPGRPRKSTAKKSAD